MNSAIGYVTDISLAAGELCNVLDQVMRLQVHSIGISASPVGGRPPT